MQGFEREQKVQNKLQQFTCMGAIRMDSDFIFWRVNSQKRNPMWFFFMLRHLSGKLSSHIYSIFLFFFLFVMRLCRSDCKRSHLFSAIHIYAVETQTHTSFWPQLTGYKFASMWKFALYVCGCVHIRFSF